VASTAGTLALIGLGLIGRLAPVKGALAALADVPFGMLAVTTAALATAMLRHRRQLSRVHHRNWLAALPSDLSLTARAALAPLPLGTAAVMLVMVATFAAGLPVQVPARLVLALTGGYLAAILLVALIARGRARARPPDSALQRVEPPASRYAVLPSDRRDWAGRPRLHPLADWPIAQARFWDRPKRQARSLFFLMTGLPMGIAGGVALALAATWLALAHLLNLLVAVVRVAFAAAWWLAPTPVGTLRFAAALSHRALGRQMIICALLVTAASAIPGAHAWPGALACAVGWLGVVLLVSALACALARGSPSVATSVLHQVLR
jgi:hypothetical protein